MTPERWQQVRALFHLAVDVARAERPAFLERACAGDRALQQEVASLLDADQPDDFLEVPAAMHPAFASNASPSPSVDPELPTRIGPYRIDRLIARGGMGAVYLAFREDEFKKKVALKIIKRGMDSDSIVRRFRNERQILAHFDHPGIAKLLDGGTASNGLPYLVMDYIEGEPIDKYCEARALGVRERLALFRTVCTAIHYAHQNLVVHRDLKPSNILIASDGQPKLLDFGIAKILSQDLAADGPDMTMTAMRVLTPEFASPEQCRGEAITTASDVYALGALLFVLLTGQRPYRLKTGSNEEIVRAVCDQDVERPSVAVPAGSPLRKQLDGDLDAIVLKALEKEPAQRYTSVEAMSADLQRYLAGRPVTARRISSAYRAAKFMRRHRLAAAVVVTVVLSVGAGVLTALWQAHVARVERARADVERNRAERRFNDVRKVAGSLLFELHDAINNGLPGALPARQLVLSRGLEYLDGLAREAGDDPALRLELAQAYSRMGQLRGDYYGNANLGDFRGAVDMYRAGVALLETPKDWPSAIRWDRANVLADLHASIAESLGVVGETETGLEEIASAHRWHEASLRDYAALHDGARAANATRRRNHLLSEADLMVMTGDFAAAFATLQTMRRAIEELFTPPDSNLPWGTYYSRLGAAQHVLAASVASRLADPIAARALMLEALSNQQQGYEFRTRANLGPNLPGQCLMFMGNLAYQLGRETEGNGWIARGIKMTESSYGVGAWGYHWRARLAIQKGQGRAALKDLANARAMHERERSIQPDGALTRNRLAAVAEDEGDAYLLVGDRASAEKAYRESLALREPLVRSRPTNAEFAGNFVYASTHVGAWLVETGRVDEARGVTRNALKILRAQADAPGAVASRATEYAWLLLTAQPIDLRDPKLALSYATRAIDLPRGIHPDALAVLAIAQFQSGQVDASVSTAVRAYDLVPLMRAGRPDTALKRDIRENLRRHPLKPAARPLWF